MASIRVLAAAGLVLAQLAACTGSPTASPSTSTTASLSPVPGRDEIVLRVSPDDLGCDAVTVPYRQVTFRIDPAAAEQVLAITDTGAELTTYWSRGFRGGSVDDPVVRAPNGDVVARDGDVLAIPPRAWPDLRGYFVCPSRDALYILSRPPA